MTNKPQKSWGDIQLAIAAVALTATIGIWNLVATGQKQQVTASANDTNVPPAEDVAQTTLATATPGFLPVKIIFGGSAPQQRVVVQASAPQTTHKGSHKPPASTGSSKP